MAVTAKGKGKKRGVNWRLVVIILNVLFIMIAMGIIGVGTWFMIERTYVSAVLQNDVYTAAALIFLFCGAVVFLVGFVGCFGAYRENRIMLIFFAIVAVIVVILLCAAAFTAVAFTGEVDDFMRNAMSDSLRYRYKNNTQNNTVNRIVTDAWDRLQVRLNCCAVDDKAWPAYQASSWYQYQLNNGYEMASIPLVPESCCKRATYDWDYILNQQACQFTQGGPPMTLIGSPNAFLNYVGCYTAGRAAILQVIWIVFVIGFVVALANIVALVGSIIMIRRIRKREKLEEAVPK